MTCCPSVKARFCRKPSTRDTRLTVLTAWTRPTKVPAGVTLLRAAAVTLTAGGVAAADAWSAVVEGRSQPQSAAARTRIPPRTPVPSRRRTVEFPRRNSREPQALGNVRRRRTVPRAAKPCQFAAFSKYNTLVGARVVARLVVVRRTTEAHYLQPVRADHVSLKLIGIGPRRRAASPSISGHRLCGLHRGQSFAHISAIVHGATRTKSAALSS